MILFLKQPGNIVTPLREAKNFKKILSGYFKQFKKKLTDSPSLIEQIEKKFPRANPTNSPPIPKKNFCM